jgi:hypothetical protein
VIIARSRFARKYIVITKIPSWVFFEGLGMENVGILDSHLEPLDIFCVHLVYFLSTGLVCCTKKNLATLLRRAFL